MTRAAHHRLDELRIDRPADRPRRPIRWLLVVLAALLLAVVAAVAWWSRDPPVRTVRTAVAREVASAAAATVLNANGYVVARRRATVSSKSTGKIVEILIEEGLRVAEGQVLARLDDTNVHDSLRLAQARLQAARAALQETRVRLREAELDRARTARLREEGVETQSALDAARAEVDSLAARLDRQSSEVTVAQREVELHRQQVEDTVIRAPFSGVVVSKDAQPGEMISPVSAGGGFTRTGIGTVVDMESLEIEVDVNESYISRVSAGQGVTAILDAHPDWKIPCSVIAVVPTADRDRATVRVRIGFDALDPRILPEMGVKVAFRAEGTAASERPALLVPSAALKGTGSSRTVLVVNGGKAERRAVSVGSVVQGEATVVAGLTAGEVVIVDAPPDLRPGEPVVPEKDR